MESASVPADQKSPPPRRLWPIGLFVVLTLLMDFAIAPIGQLLASLSLSLSLNVLVVVGGGSIIGQACFVCLVGGFWGRSWLSGYLLAVAFAGVGKFLLLFGEQLDFMIRYGKPLIWNQILALPLVVPAFVLAGISPLLVFRGRFGWRFTRLNEYSNTGQHWGVEELLIGTAVTASTLIVASSASEILQISKLPFLLPFGIGFLVIAATSLLVVVPTVWISFRITVRRRRYAFLGSMVGIIVFLAVTISVLVNEMSRTVNSVGSPLDEVILYSFSISLVSAIVFLTGLTAIKFSGYRFYQSTQDAKEPGGPINTGPQIVPIEHEASPCLFTDNEPSYPVKFSSDKLIHRALAGLILGGALVVNIVTFSILHQRVSMLAELQTHAKTFGLQGVLRLNLANQPVAIQVPPGKSIDDIPSNPSFQKIYTLSFADCRFDDDDVPKLSRYPSVVSLDLQGTNITDAGLLKLANTHPKIYKIGLARTKITRIGLERLFKQPALRELDLRGLNIDCNELANMPFISRIEGLKLGPTQVDNASLGKLLSVANALTRLDLTDCDIDETSFPVGGTRRYSELVLDGTKITDTKFASLLPSLSSDYLSISRTEITDSLLLSLPQTGSLSGLRLGESNITDKGLLIAQIRSFDKLSLNGKHFTGNCFSEWHPFLLYHLDLSNSGVTDQSLAHVVSLPKLKILNLASTHISDAGLAHIASTNINQIDLRGTKVTAAGLSDKKLAGRRIYLDINQFTSDEIRTIKNNAVLVLGQEFPR